MRKNVFVIGLDAFNLEKLEATRHAAFCAFHPLLAYEDIRETPEFHIADLLTEAEVTLERFPGSIDAIVSYWDFPTSEMVPILRRRFDLPSPTLEAVLRCHHKLWSRLEQGRIVPEAVPAFTPVDPFSSDTAPDLPYPYWLKPVRSFRSHLGFRIGDRRDLKRALTRIREEIPQIGRPFGDLLAHADVPADITRLGGSACIAEALVGGRQCTLEGYVYRGEVHVYGVIDSVREPHRPSFARYEYPSTLPRRVQERMIDTARRFLTHIGYEGAAFNMEFFYDRSRDRVWLLECNTRISQSHCDLFEKVDGASNQEIMLDLALGAEPRFPRRQGPFARAAKCFLRTFEDARIERVPAPHEIARLERAFPGTSIHINVTEGMRLSELPYQDSYSYELGHVYLGARTHRELLEAFREIRASLGFRFADPNSPEGAEDLEVGSAP